MNANEKENVLIKFNGIEYVPVVERLAGLVEQYITAQRELVESINRLVVLQEQELSTRQNHRTKLLEQLGIEHEAKQIGKKTRKPRARKQKVEKASGDIAKSEQISEIGICSHEEHIIPGLVGVIEVLGTELVETTIDPLDEAESLDDISESELAVES